MSLIMPSKDSYWFEDEPLRVAERDREGEFHLPKLVMVITGNDNPTQRISIYVFVFVAADTRNTSLG